MRLSTDIFGNKCLVLSGKDMGTKRGFSIQTNGNLPRVHRMTVNSFDPNIAWDDALEFTRAHGTDSQRKKMGV